MERIAQLAGHGLGSGYDEGRARMRVLTYQPAPPLSEYVELFRVIEGQRPDRGLERVLPTGDMQLMVGPPDGRFVAYDQATDTDVPLHELWGKERLELGERLHEAPQPSGADLKPQGEP